MNVSNSVFYRNLCAFRPLVPNFCGGQRYSFYEQGASVYEIIRANDIIFGWPIVNVEVFALSRVRTCPHVFLWRCSYPCCPLFNPGIAIDSGHE
jgi:hypothetical protein